eukprot:6111251-Lingulodinium_polyedra.AAC.1
MLKRAREIHEAFAADGRSLMGKKTAPASDPGRSPPTERPRGLAGARSDGGDSATTTDATGAARLLQ